MSERLCPWWLTFAIDNPLRRLLHPPEQVLGAWVRPGMTALDVGCGFGHFSLGMARLVGPAGRVIAADLQEPSLAVVRRRARRAGLADRITTHRCGADRCGVPGPVDFALSFWMLHETPSPERFCREIAGILSPGGRLLVVEPKIHVDERLFDEEMAGAALAGLRIVQRPRIRLSRAALLAP